jgi:hypothetical protein
MRLYHDHDIREEQLLALSHAFQNSTTSQTGDCTLCGKTVNRLKSHISRHLKQLALFAARQCHYILESEAAGTDSDMAQRSRPSSLSSQELSSELSITSGNHVRPEPKEDYIYGHRGMPTNTDIDANAWDYVTPKFQEARAAMYEDLVEVTMETATPNILMTPGPHGDTKVMNPYHQPRPICGASIGASMSGEHLPPVSLGGIILVDGEPYGLTVHHILDVASDDESDNEDMPGAQIDHHAAPHHLAAGISLVSSKQRHQLPEISDIDFTATTITSKKPSVQDKADDAEAGPKRPIKETEGLNPEVSEDEPVSEHGRFLSCPGDVEGISPGKGEDVFVTQPAFDDVHDDFFPDDDNRGRDHLDSHTFGRIYASSGVRRWKREGIVHEIDWALIKINPLRLQPYNIVLGGQRFHSGPRTEPLPFLEPPIVRRDYAVEDDEYPTGVVDADSLGGLHVHSFGRTTGLQSGVISPAMSAVKIYRRQTYSQSWTVKGDREFSGSRMCTRT